MIKIIDTLKVTTDLKYQFEKELIKGVIVKNRDTNPKYYCKMTHTMELIQIKETLSENDEFTSNPLCEDSIYMTINFYQKVGFLPPWIGYYVKKNNCLVGCAAFKGQPINSTIEIAYGTFEKYRKQGIGTQICKELVDLSLKTDPSVRITARTLPEENFSTKILKKNAFEYIGLVNDPEDGEVWEWEFKPTK